MKLRFILLLLIPFPGIFAQAPVGYYNSANGLTGAALQSALHNIITNHTVVPYSSLYAVYDSSDTKANAQVWDMYSDIPSGTPPYVYYNVSGDRCGSYTQEGDCFNREHSWPQSWFNSVSPPQSDAFHIFPTDGWVNGQRGNYPYGEVNNPTWTSLNGSKLGNNTTVGYSGTVFEPIDEYKGDMARGYFYMTTRYMGEDAGWSTSPATNGAVILPWQMCLLLTWHNQDPVSAKEIRRNNEIYEWQNNRNPFIDRPGFADSAFTCTLMGIQTLKNKIEVRVFPNPCTELVNVSVEGNQLMEKVRVLDALGREVILVPVNGSAITLSAGSLSHGIYLIEIHAGTSVCRKKLFVE